ncbi:hypothetical protein SK128_012667 [Halocaridina rubra]|uniref:Serpin domain-containing protein n=1 Tax=Halocaridina rubra TaxID=373956 RepID=A0AAN8ZZV5_HALRR
MKTLLVLATLLGIGMSFPGPLTPTVRFQARRQTNIRLGDLIQEFALDMSSDLWEKPSSVVFSPLSITSLLSVLMMGASGATKQQLHNALYYPSSVGDDVIHRSFQSLAHSLGSSNSDVIINMASRLFLQSGASILSNFTQDAQNYYDATVRTLQFRSDPLGSMNAINNWVNRNTNGKIPQLLTQPMSPDTIFVAANTVYFNGAWENPFDEFSTHDGIFNTGKTNITVPMMRTTMKVPYIFIRELNAEMIALPYKGKQFAMFFIVPKGPIEDRVLQEVEFALDADTLNRYIGEMKNSTRAIAVPRMRLDYKTYLKENLQRLNINLMFDSIRADFSKLTANDHVWVDDMIHQTVVEITETGTEAAAATATSLNRIGTSNSFEVNRPSLFFIRHLSSGLPLFWGRIIEPQPLYAQRQ